MFNVLPVSAEQSWDLPPPFLPPPSSLLFFLSFFLSLFCLYTSAGFCAFSFAARYISEHSFRKALLAYQWLGKVALGVSSAWAQFPFPPFQNVHVLCNNCGADCHPSDNRFCASLLRMEAPIMLSCIFYVRLVTTDSMRPPPPQNEWSLPSSSICASFCTWEHQTQACLRRHVQHNMSNPTNMHIACTPSPFCWLLPISHSGSPEAYERSAPCWYQESTELGLDEYFAWANFDVDGFHVFYPENISEHTS